VLASQAQMKIQNETVHFIEKQRNYSKKCVLKPSFNPVAIIGASLLGISLTPPFLQAKTRMASQVKVKFSFSLQRLTISLIVLPGLTPRIRRLGKVNRPQSA
jgi:hypothetical protein